jgi:hypothetical protein
VGDATPRAANHARESEATDDLNIVHGRIGNSAVPPSDTPADEQLARMLILMWSLASGRRLPPGTRLEDLTADELINFWADDLIPGSAGRHARGPAHAEVAA